MAVLGRDDRFDTKLIAVRELGVDSLWDGHVRGMVYNTTSMMWEASTAASGGGSGTGLTDAQLRAAAVPVSNASLPLPAGASTSANQTSANSSLASVDTKTPALGQALAAGSTPVAED